MQDSYTQTRQALHAVTVHILARARFEATGRFSLRVTPNGIGTPEFGNNLTRIRINGHSLLVESDQPGSARCHTIEIDGATLKELAHTAGVDLSKKLDIGHEAPAPQETDKPLELDHGSAEALGTVFITANRILDATLASLGGCAKTPPRLWPEHFDLAIEAQVSSTQRVNLGVSPGDEFCETPYIYVGPWTSARPGPTSWWNASFGAFRPLRDLGTLEPEITQAGVEFLLDGVSRLQNA